MQTESCAPAAGRPTSRIHNFKRSVTFMIGPYIPRTDIPTPQTDTGSALFFFLENAEHTRDPCLFMSYVRDHNQPNSHNASAHDRKRLESFKVVYIQRKKELSRFGTWLSEPYATLSSARSVGQCSRTATGGIAGSFEFGVLLGERSGIVVTWVVDGIGSIRR